MIDASAPHGAAQRTVRVADHVRIARDTYRLRLHDPELAAAIVPGQFLMIRPTAATAGGMAADPLLGRPFALYDVARDGDRPVAVDVVYVVLGRGTALLTSVRPGDALSIWGPLGNGFGPPPADQDVLFVAGGIGQTPFLALGRRWLGAADYGAPGGGVIAPARSATLLYGVRSADLAAGVDDFRRAGIAVELATDDGSAGRRGYVTDLLRERLDRGQRPAKVVGCGPVPMLRALSRIASEAGLDCDLSLESPMACGFGACFSCVVPIRQPDGSADLRRICVEGPIFPAADVAWD